MSSTARPLSLVVALVGAALVTGCKNTVAGGGESGEGGAGGGGPVTSAATTVGHGPTTSAATTSGPVTSAAVTVGVSTGGGPSSPGATLRRNNPTDEASICDWQMCDFAPDAVILVIDSAELVCGAPLDRPLGSGNGWRLVIGIPPEKLAVGTYVFDDHPDIVTVVMGEASANETSAVSVGGGDWLDGQIEIVAVDGLQVTVRTTGIASNFVESDGEWVTTPCE
jgi:hypothetical protein